MTQQEALATLLLVLIPVVFSEDPLVSDVVCPEFNDPDREDSSWDFNNWNAGVQHIQKEGDTSILIMDMEIGVDRESGICLSLHATVCKLTTTNVEIGDIRMDSAGNSQYPGLAFLIKQEANTLRWVTRSGTSCHGHKMRVQVRGKPTGGDPSAMLYCGNARSSNDDPPIMHAACHVVHSNPA